MRRFIETKTKSTTAAELIVLCGDMNVNGRKVDRVNVESYRLMLKERVSKEMKSDHITLA